MRTKEIKPIPEKPSDYDHLEDIILKMFREEIYYPLLEELQVPKKTIINSSDVILAAIQSGLIYFSRGQFKGRFNAALSRELKRIGAKWDPKQVSWRIPLSSLSQDIRTAISASEFRFTQVLQKIDDRLAKQSAKFADIVKIDQFFDKTLFKLDGEIKKSLKGIAISPELTDYQRKVISAEYTKNLNLYIQDFTKKETNELRKKMQERVLKGYRYEGVIKEIQKSYGVSHRKAKFLARQETSLMMTSFKQSRYTGAGVNQYRWHCVVGSAKHPVRPMHKIHDGKIYRFDQPPIVDLKGNRKNPGQDYNCRCVAIPLVKFNE